MAELRVTRDVVYDLLPLYLSGHASPDSRALVEDFLADDPWFHQLSARFRRPGAPWFGSEGGHVGRSLIPNSDRRFLSQGTGFSMAICFGLGALVALLAAFAAPAGAREPRLIIAATFAATAAGALVLKTFRLK